eukprot:g46410.t1
MLHETVPESALGVTDVEEATSGAMDTIDQDGGRTGEPLLDMKDLLWAFNGVQGRGVGAGAWVRAGVVQVAVGISGLENGVGVEVVTRDGDGEGQEGDGGIGDGPALFHRLATVYTGPNQHRSHQSSGTILRHLANLGAVTSADIAAAKSDARSDANPGKVSRGCLDTATGSALGPLESALGFLTAANAVRTQDKRGIEAVTSSISISDSKISSILDGQGEPRGSGAIKKGIGELGTFCSRTVCKFATFI